MKKFFFLAFFILSLFLFGCPADGYIDSSGVHWESYPPSNFSNGDVYCFDADGLEDCEPIGGLYSCWDSEERCVYVGGTVHTESWCRSNARRFYNCNDW